MHKVLTLLLAGWMLSLTSCVHRSQMPRPAQTVRVSDALRAPASYGTAKTRGTPSRYAQAEMERARRMEARREVAASRSRSRSRAQVQPANLREVSWRSNDMNWAAAPRSSMDTALVYQLPSGPAPGGAMPSRNSGSGGAARSTGASSASTTSGSRLTMAPSASPGQGRSEEASRKPEPAKTKPETTESGSKSSGEFDHLPFGVPVSGKPGYVILPEKGGSLPEIDVRGIAPGTPVEVPDPAAPGATIQFRVP